MSAPRSIATLKHNKASTSTTSLRHLGDLSASLPPSQINQLEVAGGQNTDIQTSAFEGKWELVYTNAAELLGLLAVNRLPVTPVHIGRITQNIDSATGTVENSVELQVGLCTRRSTMPARCSCCAVA